MRKQWWSPKVWVQPASTRIYTGHRFGGKKQLATVAVQLWFISRTIWSSSSQSIWSQLTYCILLYGLVIHNIYICIYLGYIYIYVLYSIFMDHEILKLPMLCCLVSRSYPRSSSLDLILAKNVRRFFVRSGGWGWGWAWWIHTGYKENWHQSTFVNIGFNLREDLVI